MVRCILVEISVIFLIKMFFVCKYSYWVFVLMSYMFREVVSYYVSVVVSCIDIYNIK